MTDIDIKNNRRENRFEAAVDGGTALVEYRQGNGEIEFLHTEVPPQSGGKGVAQALVRKALQYARDERLQVIPSCEYVASFVKRHRDYDDILHPDYRGA